MNKFICPKWSFVNRQGEIMARTYTHEEWAQLTPKQQDIIKRAALFTDVPLRDIDKLPDPDYGF